MYYIPVFRKSPEETLAKLKRLCKKMGDKGALHIMVFGKPEEGKPLTEAMKECDYWINTENYQGLLDTFNQIGYDRRTPFFFFDKNNILMGIYEIQPYRGKEVFSVCKRNNRRLHALVSATPTEVYRRIEDLKRPSVIFQRMVNEYGSNRTGPGWGTMRKRLTGASLQLLAAVLGDRQEFSYLNRFSPRINLPSSVDNIQMEK